MKYAAPGIEIEMKREDVEVSTLHPTRVPDAKWEYIDGHDHAHRFIGESVPSTKWVVTGTTWVGDCYDAMEVDIGEYRCIKCDDVVEPGYTVTYGVREFVPGLLEITIKTEFGRYWLRQEELEEFQRTPVGDREALARRIAASRDPDDWHPITV